MALTKVGKEGITGIDNSSDATAITIDSSEHVGIGIADPDGTLHVHSASAGSVTPQTDSDDLVVENNGHGGISVLTPDANRSAIVFGHASDNLKMQIRHDGGTSLSQIISDDTLTFNVSGGTERMRIDTNGHITMPTQTAFGAIGSSTPTLPINTTYVLPLDLERFDQNADYNTSNYTFTAPVTGRYQLNGSIYLYNYLDTSAGYIMFTLRTSNDEYQYPVQASMFGSDIGSFGMNISHLVDMDASDTAVIDIFQQAGAAQTSISGGHSHFTGFLVA